MALEELVGTVVRFDLGQVEAFVADTLVAGGVAPDKAQVAASHLLLADLRGVESHGVARLPGYVARLKAGLIDPQAEVTVVHELASTLALDAHNGLGLLAGQDAMGRTIAKAEESGICMTTVRNSNHFGIAGAYAVMAAERGLGGMAMTNASRLVVPTFASGPMLGTNPIAFAVPVRGARPLIVDMSTSTVAWGKIEIARRAGIPIPAGWAVDADGAPTTDPSAVKGLTPLGGDRTMSGHKGYGLGLMVDILCAVLAGSSWSWDIGRTTELSYSGGIGHFFLAWRIDAFRDPEEFADQMDKVIGEIRAMKVADGAPSNRVLVPGDPEMEAEAENLRLGVPIRTEVLAELAVMANEIGIPPLA
ncbi:MAG TPA: Ldh family oxidoreductase [Thermomicrobiales bacterium]|nr:Ldh family oxidoreductase [Thermomicrobiales bacterium]